jgi:predicted lipid-binding transport protein (Tim44 family)
MGNQVIDVILFALVALFLVYRLWLVLGRRTGTERPPVVPPSVSRFGSIGNARPAPAPPPVQPAPITAPDPLSAGLAEIGRADPAFRPETFLGGARHAFELIVKSFAENDTVTLRPLLSDDVYDTFAEAIRHRLGAKETLATTITRLADPRLVEARLDGRTALITVKFQSTQISVTRDAEGRLLEGHPDHPVDRIDFWTFSRNTRSTDPNWTLVATGAAE